MIVKDEVEAVNRLVEQALPYFDGIYITVSGPIRNFKKHPKVKIDHRDWNDRFDDARNHNFAQGDTDFKFWLDSDDEFDFSVIPKMVELAESGPYDAIWLPYHYAHDEDGNVIALHWRERLLRASKGWEWKGWVHENALTDQHIKSKRANYPIIHRSDHKEQSEERNHKILEKAYEETNDPRYIHYLGISYYTQEKWQDCIDVLKQYVQVGGWDEEIYRSLVKMSEASNNLGKTEDAMQYILRAAGLMPEYPQAYFNLAQLEFEQENFKQALEWLKVAFSKPQPETAAIIDPTMTDRAKLIGAISEFKLGNNSQALQVLNTIQTIDVDDLKPSFQYETSLDNLASVLPALLKHYQAPEQLWTGLKDDVKYDNRFRKIREALTEPKTWPKKSIVFFCGRGYEEWGPHTLDKGMGGSEEAVVYLSRQLSTLGYNVTVFGEISKPFTDAEHDRGNSTEYSVEWLPWTHIDKRDTFDTLIIWRYPQFAPQFKARRKLIDMHDLLPAKVLRPYPDATYLFKSAWQKDQHPDITNYKVIGNGIQKSHFEGSKKKKKHSVGYFSAYYRGLEVLLAMWPEIRKEVPDATLDIYYGWESWVSAEGQDNFYQRMIKKLELLKGHGVTEHGRVDHETLAKAMNETQVWAYPTEFEEIHCITALKAQEAECWPVVTNVAALQETVQSGVKIDTKMIYGDEYNRKKFIKAVVAGLKDNKRGVPVAGVDWADRAKAWAEVIEHE